MDMRFAIAFAGKGEYGVGPGLDTAADQTRKVYAKKGEFRIRNRLNQVINQMLRTGFELKILATKGDDA